MGLFQYMTIDGNLSVSGDLYSNSAIINSENASLVTAAIALGMDVSSGESDEEV